MTVVDFFAIFVSLLLGSIVGLVLIKLIEDIEVWCLIGVNPKAIAFYYKGELIKNRFAIAAIKLLRTIVLRIAK